MTVMAGWKTSNKKSNLNPNMLCKEKTDFPEHVKKKKKHFVLNATNIAHVNVDSLLYCLIFSVNMSQVINIISHTFLRSTTGKDLASCVFHISPLETGDLCMTGPPSSIWIRASSMARTPPVNTACVISESWRNPSSTDIKETEKVLAIYLTSHVGADFNNSCCRADILDVKHNSRKWTKQIIRIISL